MKKVSQRRRAESFAAGVGRALRRAAQAARKTARMYGTPVYIWKDGKVVAEKPKAMLQGFGNHLDAFVRGQIASGRYSSQIEVIRRGLRLLEKTQKRRKRKR